MDKRAFKRIPMTLEVRLVDARGRSWAGVTRDFCAGGLLVALERSAATGNGELPEDTEVSVRVTVKGEDFAIPATVVRRLSSRVGLAFRNPDQAALAALQKMAVDSHRPMPDTAPPRGAKAEQVLKDCRELVREGLTARIRGFNAEIEGDLVRAAAAAANNVEEARYFDAITAIKPLRPKLESALAETAPAHVMELGRFALQPNDILEATWSGDLSLVDEEVFEDFLVLSEIAVRANDRFHGPLQELDRRLSRLAGTRIEERTNPVSPEAVCEAFREAINELRAHRDAFQVIYRAFEERVVSGLGPIFEGLNRLLAERGIDPVAEDRPRVTRKPGPAPSPARAPETAGEPAPAPEAPPAKARPEGGHGAEAGTGRPAPTPPGAAPSGPGGGTEERGERARMVDAAYHTAQRLLDMEQVLLRHTQEQTLPRSMIARDESAGAYAPEEVAAGLADLQQRLPAAEAGALSPEEMEEQLFRTLSVRHPESGRKQLGEGEATSLRLISGLLSALLEDPELGGAVKRRIRKLRVPIHRVGLEDESFITDENHTARRVLDEMAGLEADMELTGGVMGNRLDSLVERILAERDHPADAFAAALPELEEMKVEQEQAYGDGVAKVVQECRQRSEFLRSRRKGEEGGSRQRIVGSPEEQRAWQQWIQRVDRLQQGDAVLFERDTPHPRRAQLVWVDDHRDEFVFVDGRGRKSDTLSARELAMGLRRGNTEVLPPRSLAPVERATLDMLRGVQQRLQREATHDPVTGLPNERELKRLLEEALHRAVQEKVEHVVGYVSLVNFRDTQSALGRDAAVELLRQSGALMAEMGHGRLHFGDLGQGRFGLLLEETGLEEAGDRLDPLLEPDEDSALEWEGERVPLKFAVGLAALGPNTPTAAAAMEAAAAACRQAREEGTGLRLAAQEEREAQRKRIMADWAERLNATLREERLLLRAQRVVPLARDGSARPFYELLLGLRDENGEAISPREFLEAAEYYNQLLAVDHWVIRNVIQWLAGNPAGLDAIDGFTINLSGASLVDDRLGDYVLELLLNSSLPPGRLCFEVSQSDALTHHSNAERFIRTVTDLGCRIALHDFGHGDSSYAYLKELPVDYIKIGGTFVEGMARNPSDHAVVNSINEIAHMMGKRTVAEHVESEAAMVRLRDMGVDFAQGYYVDRPRYLEELLEQGLGG